MGLSYDSASNILLCAEDNTSILCFDDEIQQEEEEYTQQENFLMGFPLQSDECLDLMVKREVDHLPKEDYLTKLINGDLDISVRNDAVDWILKAHAHFNFGSLSAYLSVNYMDRFISAYEFPQGRAWMTQLLSVACLSLAAKIEEAKIPISIDLQVCEPKFVFEAKTIQRMELLVLDTLKWKMQALTPFSFIDYYLHNLNDGLPPTRALLHRSAEIILCTSKGVEFLAFRPSEIAAAVAMAALGETQEIDIEKAVVCCKYVNKEKMLNCYEVIQEVILMKSVHIKNVSSSSIPSLPQSPNGVLDANMSYKSDDTTNDSHESTQHSSPASKRRKINRPSIS